MEMEKKKNVEKHVDMEKTKDDGNDRKKAENGKQKF